MRSVILQNPKLKFILSHRSDKKTTKSFIIQIHLSDYLTIAQNHNLKISSLLLLGIVKIYVKKVKYLLDDTSDLYNSLRPQKTRNKLLQPVNRIEIDFSDLYHPEEDIYHSVIDTFVSNINDNIVSDRNFSMSHVEVARNESFKRRKIDDTIELDSNMIKTRFVKTKAKEQDVMPDIPEFVRNILNNCKMPVEIARADTMIEHYEPEQSSFVMQSENDVLSGCSSEIEFIDDVFCFNELVVGKDRYDKAKTFMSVLGMCSLGRMKCEQKEAYTNIICYKI